MSILLVYNEFLRGEIYSRHIAEYAKNLPGCKIMSNAELLTRIPNVKKALMLDKDLYLCRRLEDSGIKTYNSEAAIAICDSKAETYLTLRRKNLKTPQTLIPPFTYDNIGYTHTDFLKVGEYPVVIKECFGSFGEGVYLANNKAQAEEIFRRCKKPLVQKFISECAGVDIRVLVCGGEVVAAMKRSSTSGDFRSNLYLGGKGEKFSASDEMKKTAIAAAMAVGCEFCGVDILLSGDVLEVNSNPFMSGICAISGVDCYKIVADFVVGDNSKR